MVDDRNYTVLHIHSMLSNGVTNIDSVTSYQEYVDYAKSLGMKALCFSEHGSVFEWVKKKQAIEAAGMKYIHGIEAYVTQTLDEKIRDNKHCLLIAKNWDGVKEINQLSSKSFNREDGHYYYVPRITLDELLNTSDNIIVSTACLGGILVNCDDSMRKAFLKFLIKNKHRCYLELQHHNVADQIKYNEYLYRLSLKYDIPCITTTDTHALNDEHLKGRSILQKAKNINFDNEEGWDLTFKTYEGLVAAFDMQHSNIPKEFILEAIENTNRLADSIETFELDYSYKYPHLWENPEKLLMQKIKAGIKKRGVDKYKNRDEYAARIKHELKAYKHNQAIDFMLLMEDIANWCRSQDIALGYGRGSVNGSVIAWLLGITEMDSIKHNLNFERFMNIERVSLSDIDTDFPPSRINEVKDYIFTHKGLYCSDIITFNTIADKGAIRDVCRALYKDSDNDYMKITDEICAMFDENYEKARAEYPEVFKYVDIVKGTVVSIGSHPCGLVCSPITLDDSMGLCTTSTDNYPISQIYMKEIDSLNYVKLDLLKLDTIELISNTCKMANIPMILPETLDINDIKVWNSMRDDTTCIFQWEGTTGNDYIKKLLNDENINKYKEVNENVDRMTLLSIGNSAIRPAGASYREDLANGVVRKTGSKPIDDFLSNTFGYLVFQCQIIDFLHLYCGFTMGEADIVRRGFAKKTGTDQYIPIIKDGGKLTPNSDHEIDGYIKTMEERYGISREKSEEDITAFIQVIEDASSYLFSLNHSAPYSYEGYACAYLRYYYPLEFLTCALNINKDKEEKTIAVSSYANKIGIKIVSPKFRYSLADYSCNKEQNCIYKGIQSIKFLNDTIADDLYALRDNKYDSFAALLVDIKNTSVNSRQLEILIKLDFFSEFGQPNELMKKVELFDKLYSKKQFKKDKLEELGIPEYLMEKYAEKKTEKLYKDVDTSALLHELFNTIEFEDTSTIDKIKYELEYLGYISLTIPDINEDYYFIQSIDKNWMTVYQLCSGKTEKKKFRANSLKNCGGKAGDMIKIITEGLEPRFFKNADGTWGRDYDNQENILKKWSVLL